MLVFPFLTLEQYTTFKESMINQLSNLINRNHSAAKISKVLCSIKYLHLLPKTSFNLSNKNKSLPFGPLVVIVIALEINLINFLSNEIPTYVLFCPAPACTFLVLACLAPPRRKKGRPAQCASLIYSWYTMIYNQFVIYLEFCHEYNHNFLGLMRSGRDAI